MLLMQYNSVTISFVEGRVIVYRIYGLIGCPCKRSSITLQQKYASLAIATTYKLENQQPRLVFVLRIRLVWRQSHLSFSGTCDLQTLSNKKKLSLNQLPKILPKSNCHTRHTNTPCITFVPHQPMHLTCHIPCHCWLIRPNRSVLVFSCRAALVSTAW